MDNNRNKDSFLKGAIILGSAGIIVKIMGAFFRIPLGNLIGSTGMGYYQAAYPVYTLFLTLATAGFPTALAKLVSEKTAIGDHRGAHKIFKVAYTVLFMTGIVSFAIFFFGAEYIVKNIMKNPGAYYSMLAIAPALIFVPVMSSYRGYFQGKRDMSKIAISQIGEQFFRVILGIGLAYVLMNSYGEEMGAAGAIAGATVGAIASILYLIFAYLRDGKSRKAQIKASKRFREESTSRILKKILVVAIPITIGASVMPLVNMIDNVIVISRLEAGGYSNVEAVALFGQLTGMAMAIINLPSVVTAAMGMSLVPSISEAYALGNKGRARKDTRSAIKVTLLLVLPCAFGLASLASPIMKLLYPNESGLGTILLVLTPCVVFLGLMQTMNGILQGMGKPMVPVVALIIGMLSKIVISFTLTVNPDINVIGSAIGTVSAYFLAALIEFTYIKKYMNMKFGKKEFVIKPLITVLTMFVIVKLSYGLFNGMLGNSLSTIVSIGIGGIVYGLVLLGIGGIRKEELLTMPKGNKIYNILRKLKLMR